MPISIAAQELLYPVPLQHLLVSLQVCQGPAAQRPSQLEFRDVPSCWKIVQALLNHRCAAQVT